MKKNIRKISMLALGSLILSIVTPLSTSCKGEALYCKIKREIEECCHRLSKKIDHISVACSKPHPIYQKDIDKAVEAALSGASSHLFDIDEEGYWYLAEDIYFNSEALSNSTISAVANSFIGWAAINVIAPNVNLDFCNHTLTIDGPKATGVAIFNPTINGEIPFTTQPDATLPGASRVRVHNGTIQGVINSTIATAANGIYVYSNDTIISDMQFLNISGGPVFELTFIYPPSSAITLQGADVPNDLAPNIAYTPFNGCIIEQCTFTGNAYGINVSNWSDNLIIRDCAVNNSTHMGFTAAARFGLAPNVYLENVSIAHSGEHGFYSNWPNANVILQNVSISESALNGMALFGYANLQLQQCQVYSSGAHGILLSADGSQNVSLENTQIFNAGLEALRVDNVENLIMNKVQVTNYLETAFVAGTSTANAIAYPLVRLQDVRGGIISESILSNPSGTNDVFSAHNVSGFIIEDSVVTVYQNTGTTNYGFNFNGGNSNITLRNSKVAGTPYYGIYVGSNASTPESNVGIVIDSNSVENASQIGIFLDVAVNCTVQSCTVTGSGVFGISDTSKANAIYHNSVSGTGLTGANYSISSSLPFITVTTTTPLTPTTGWYTNVGYPLV